MAKRAKEINQIENLIGKISRKILFGVSYLTSYSFSVAIFSAGFAGLVCTLFAFYYFDAVNVAVSQGFLNYLKFAIGLAWLILIVQHGFLHRLGISGWGKPILDLNHFTNSKNQHNIKDGISDAELLQLYHSLVRFPKFITLNVFSWVIGIIFISTLVGLYTEINKKDFLFSIANISYIVLFNIYCLTLISSEVITGSMREKCKILLNERNIPYFDKANSTVRLKFIFFLFLLGVSLYLSIVVTYYNHDEMNKVVSFSLLVVIVSNLFAYMIFKIIYNSLSQIEDAAYNLAAGGSGQIFPRSLDKEFINVAIGMNEASTTILDYKHSMEEKVRQRTNELNIAYSELAAKNEMIEQELEFAKNIQQGIIPLNLSPWNGISFASHYEPMGSVSGDYYDVFFFDKQIYVLMADVSGHGVPAALITMTAKQVFSQVIKEDSSPAEIFKTVNPILTKRVKTSDYLSAFLFKIDEKNRITYANAAHPNAVHYIRASNEYLLLDTEGMFIGAIDEASDHYEEKQTRLQSGDRIYLYTDGVIEHKNLHGEEFGMTRFLETLSITKMKTIAEQIDSVISSLKNFMDGAPIKDDISMFVFELDPSWAKFAEVYNEGLKSLRDKNFVAAVDKFKESLLMIPSFFGLHYQTALSYFYIRELNVAKENIDKFLKFKPKDIRGLKLAIKIYEALKLENEVIQFTKRLNEKH
jgi:serine phosphatase RsbU (regulator of sigma subunit)